MGVPKPFFYVEGGISGTSGGYGGVDVALYGGEVSFVINTITPYGEAYLFYSTFWGLIVTTSR